MHARFNTQAAHSRDMVLTSQSRHGAYVIVVIVDERESEEREHESSRRLHALHLDSVLRRVRQALVALRGLVTAEQHPKGTRCQQQREYTS